MGKKILFVLVTTVLFLLSVKPAQAELVAGNSAVMHYTASSKTDHTEGMEMFIKRKALKAYLEKQNAPLAAHVNTFMKACEEYNIDCYLLPAITGVESSFGVYMAPGTNNPFGWGRGLIPFNTFDDAIMTVGKGLRDNYINRGATTVEQIGSIYCEGNTWAGKVNHFMHLMGQEEQNQLLLSLNTVQL